MGIVRAPFDIVLTTLRDVKRPLASVDIPSGEREGGREREEGGMEREEGGREDRGRREGRVGVKKVKTGNAPCPYQR